MSANEHSKYILDIKKVYYLNLDGNDITKIKSLWRTVKFLLKIGP